MACYKILLINTFYYPQVVGGAEISTQKLAESLAQNGNDVTVLTTGCRDVKETINNVAVYRIRVNNICQPADLPHVNKLVFWLYRIVDTYNIFNYSKIMKLIKNVDPDVIHHNNGRGFSPIVFRIANKLNIRTVLTFRDYYFMCPRYNMIKKNGLQCIAPKKICKIYRKINKAILRDISFFTAPSQHTLNKFYELGYFERIQSKKVFNAINFSFESVRQLCKHKKEAILAKDKILFVFMSRLERSKGIRVLLSEFLKFNEEMIELHIAGTGNQLKHVQDIAAVNRGVFYHGFLNETDKNKLLAMADVMIIPSLYEEPFGRVVIEAYLHGMPVIGSKRGGIAEIIRHNETGLLIDVEKEGELMDAIIKLSDRKNIFNMIDKCCEYLKEFSIDGQVAEFIKIYKSG